MSPLVRKRLEAALAAGGRHHVEVLAPDVLAACAALPADEVTARLAGACARVVPSTSGRKRDEAPAPRVWLAAADLDHLLGARDG